jgi:hypothetical protein
VTAPTRRMAGRRRSPRHRALLGEDRRGRSSLAAARLQCAPPASPPCSRPGANALPQTARHGLPHHAGEGRSRVGRASPSSPTTRCIAARAPG